MSQATAVALFQPGTPMAVPEYIANAFGEAETNMEEKFPSLPQLRFKGKQWRISIDDEEMAMTRKNADGDDEPMPVMKVVILDMNPKRSRAYYEGDFVEGKSSPPKCYSKDGVVPDSEVSEPCARTCAECEFSQKGSKPSDTGKATACSQFKRIAVVPVNNLDFSPLLLRIPQTSLWDKDGAEQASKGWFALDQFLDTIRKAGVRHSAALVVKIKFDPSPAYPKLLFAADRWLDAEEIAKIKTLLVEKRADLDAIIGASELVETRPETAAETPANVTAPAKPKALSRATPAKATPTKTVPATIIDPDTGDEIPNPALYKGAPAKAAAPAAQVAKPTPAPAVTADAGLASVLNAWDE